MNHLRTDYLIGGDLPASMLDSTPSSDHENEEHELGSEAIGYISVAAVFALVFMGQCIRAYHTEHDN